MLSILTSVLIVVSVPVIYWIFLCLQKILYVAKCRRRTNQLPGLPTLPLIGNLHQVWLIAELSQFMKMSIIFGKFLQIVGPQLQDNLR